MENKEIKECKHEWHQPKGSNSITCQKCGGLEPVFYNNNPKDI